MITAIAGGVFLLISSGAEIHASLSVERSSVSGREVRIVVNVRILPFSYCHNLTRFTAVTFDDFSCGYHRSKLINKFDRSVFFRRHVFLSINYYALGFVMGKIIFVSSQKGLYPSPPS